MLLENKTTVIYGAGGAVGGAVARTFAREGATLFLTGRSLARVDAVAKEIVAAGGVVETAQVDALDEKAVEEHLNTVVERAGGVDISFNAIGLRQTTLQGVPLVELDLHQFMAPISTHVQATFLTARLSGRRMAAAGSGVIMTVTATLSRVATPLVGGMAVAAAAEEALIRDLSVELAPQGVRVLGVRAHGMPETSPIQEVFGLHAKAYGITPEQFQDLIAERTHSRRLPTLQELAEVAAFMASDRASAMEGTLVNLSLGAIAD